MSSTLLQLPGRAGTGTMQRDTSPAAVQPQQEHRIVRLVADQHPEHVFAGSWPHSSAVISCRPPRSQVRSFSSPTLPGSCGKERAAAQHGIRRPQGEHRPGELEQVARARASGASRPR